MTCDWRTLRLVPSGRQNRSKVEQCAAVHLLPSSSCRCLQENRKRPTGFGAECKAELQKTEQRMAQDYRLNYRLAKACSKDIDSMCQGLCKPDQVRGS